MLIICIMQTVEMKQVLKSCGEVTSCRNSLYPLLIMSKVRRPSVSGRKSFAMVLWFDVLMLSECRSIVI